MTKCEVRKLAAKIIKYVKETPDLQRSLISAKALGEASKALGVQQFYLMLYIKTNSRELLEAALLDPEV